MTNYVQSFRRQLIGPMSTYNPIYLDYIAFRLQRNVFHFSNMLTKTCNKTSSQYQSGFQEKRN